MTNVLIFYPPHVLYYACNVPFSIGYNNPDRLKDIDKIVIDEQCILTDRSKYVPHLKTLYQALKNDDIDLFIDICVQFPECINNIYNYRIYSIRLFELTILFNAIKCFKYMIINNYYNVNENYSFLGRSIAVSNNFEIIRLLENNGFDIFKISDILYDLIDYHRNDILKYIFYRNTINGRIEYCFENSISSYNYDIMLYIMENYNYIPNNTSQYGDIHMPSILYISNKYNIEFLENSLNIIPTQEQSVE